MASLWFQTAEVIFAPPRTLSQFKALMEDRMQQGGFTAVVNNDSEVAGGRDGGWTSVAPLFKADRGGGTLDYILVIMCGAETMDVAKANVSDVYQMTNWPDVGDLSGVLGRMGGGQL
jgi:hypothetical protein